MKIKSFLAGMVLLVGCSSSQAQLHVAPKGWARPAPQPDLQTSEKHREVVLRRVIAQLEHERHVWLKRPKTENSKVHLVALEFQIRSFREMLLHGEVVPTGQLLSSK